MVQQSDGWQQRESARSMGAQEVDEPPDPRRVDAAQSLVGQCISERYELVRLIAVGGSGDIYEAKQRALKRAVAVKLIQLPTDQPRGQVHERFKREAETLARLTHPHIVSVLDVGIWRDQGFLVMELLQGQSLADLLHAEPKLSLPRLLSLGRQLCQALDVMHRAGLIHRDLKPDNIFLTRFGEEEEHVKVIDFGVVKDTQQDANLTVQGTLIGTPRYMAPEQITCAAEEIGPATDIYAVGAILFRAAVGQPVFLQRDTMGQLIAHVRENPRAFRAVDPEHGLPASFERVVQRCLAKRPADRFLSARALEQALHEVESSLGGRGMAPGGVLRVPQPTAPMHTPAAGSLSAHERTLAWVGELDEVEELEEIPPRRASPSTQAIVLAAGIVVGAICGLAWTLSGVREPSSITLPMPEMRAAEVVPPLPAGE